MDILHIVRSLERNRRLALWLPVPKIRAVVPEGYVVNPENPEECIPDIPRMELLLKAREFLKRSPYRDVAIWLNKHGCKINKSSLCDLMNKRPPYSADERRLYGYTADTRAINESSEEAS